MTIGIIFSLIIGFLSGLLSWLLKDIFDSNKMKKKMLKYVKLELTTCLTILNEEFSTSFDLYHEDIDFLKMKIDNLLPLQFFNTNIINSSFFDHKTRYDIYLTYLNINYSKKKIIDIIEKNKRLDINCEIKYMKSKLQELGKKNKNFKEFKKIEID